MVDRFILREYVHLAGGTAIFLISGAVVFGMVILNCLILHNPNNPDSLRICRS